MEKLDVRVVEGRPGTPVTEVEVRQLALEDSGATLSTIALLHGTAYIDFRKHKEDVFNLVLPDHEIALTHAVRLRTEAASQPDVVRVETQRTVQVVLDPQRPARRRPTCTRPGRSRTRSCSAS